MKRVKIGMGNAELTAAKGTIYEKFTQKMTILHKERRTEQWNNGMVEYWNDGPAEKWNKLRLKGL
jgi:hypothetical protein